MHTFRLEASQRGKMPAASSTSSLSSSLDSAGSSILPAAPPSNSSQSDIVTYDHKVRQSPSPAPGPISIPSPTVILGAPRSSSLANHAMGHVLSRPAPATPPPSQPQAPTSPSKATSRFKRVFGGGRRKKSDDSAQEGALDLPPVPPLKIKGKQREASPLGGGRPAPLALVPRSSSSTSSALSSASNSGSSHGHGRPARQSPPFWTAAKGKVPSPEPSPPLPPPKSSIPSSLLPHPHATARATLEAGPPASRSDQRGSFLVSSPITAALEYIKVNEQTDEPVTAGNRPKRDPELEKVKEDWRKSDSTTTSYYTVRPRSGTSGGTRTPRPVSMAESTNTVVPAATRRMSALITDAEFVMPEEDTPDSAHSTLGKRASLSRQISPAGSSKARKRQSISLHIASPFVPASRGHVSPPTTSEMPALTRAAASGIMANASAGGQIKGRLEAWTAPPSIQEPPSSPSSRSISSGSGRPPAGVMGFGRRAMERMGRAIGHLGAGAHHHHHGASSNPGSSSSSLASEDALGRTHSNLSTPGHAGLAALGKGKHPPSHWRTPNAPSGTWSISTTGTGSSVDTDAVMSMGRRLRAPVAGGLVFGKALSRCVRVTAVEPVRLALAGQGSLEALEKAGGDVLERRLLPALVVRCAQHLHRWGIEEEGLFRISGRASHIAKLRSEFDTGADYDLRDCAPGDLDPHAVSGIFKAYLRELPEPILTHALNPYFEAAMHAETNSRKQESPTYTRHAGGATLPSNPRNGNPQPPSLRKPPSLSTLAMPSFAGMRPPSDGLLAAFSALISRLPRENRDLLRTLTELINATASRKETRMPLSNLTVIFCPSLNMSPPILRVLCEAKNIWDGPLKDAVEEQVLDIKRAEPSPSEEAVAVHATGMGDERTEEHSVLDIRKEDSQDGNIQATAADDDEADAGMEDQSTANDDQLIAPVLTTQSDAVAASSEEISDSPSVPETDGEDVSPPALEQSQSRSSVDNESFVSAGEMRPATPQLSNPQSPQSPQILSSSAESLATPSNFSDDASAPLQDQPVKKLTASPPNSPAIADVDSETPLPIAPSHSRPLPVVIAPVISHMASVAFPMTERAPSTPYTPSAQASTNPEPVLTSPSTATAPSETSSLRGSVRTRSLRMKRPSLSVLFKKRSMSSIGSSKGGLASPYTPLPPLPTESPCASPTSSGSPSTPISASSMVTAPMANSRFSLPPMLDTQIDSSSLDLTLGVESVEEGEDENAHSGDDTTVEGTIDAQHTKARAVASDPAVHRTGPNTSIPARAISPISPATTISTTSPISPSSSTPTAERFRISGAATSSTTSSVYMSASSSIQGTTLRPQASQASIASSAYNRLSVWDDDEDMPPEDNWADAVLMEAEKGWAARRKSRMPQT